METMEAKRLIQSQIDYLKACLMESGPKYSEDEWDQVMAKIDSLRMDLAGL